MTKKTKTLVEQMRTGLEDARRQLGLAANDFSTPDDRLLEMRSDVRRLQDEVANLEKKSKRLFGIF
jgi:chromosome segregation ATPase